MVFSILENIYLSCTFVKYIYQKLNFHNISKLREDAYYTFTQRNFLNAQQTWQDRILVEVGSNAERSDRISLL